MGPYAASAQYVASSAEGECGVCGECAECGGWETLEEGDCECGEWEEEGECGAAGQRACADSAQLQYSSAASAPSPPHAALSAHTLSAFQPPYLYNKNNVHCYTMISLLMG